MTTPVIIDIVIAVFLAGFCIWGACRGLFRALAGLVIVAAALIGAAMIAATFAPPAAKLVAPMIRERIAQRVEDAAEERSGEMEDGEIARILEQLGLETDRWEEMTRQTEETLKDTGTDLLSAVAEGLVQSVLYGVLYLLSFLALTLLLRTLLRAMDLVLRLPGLHLLNAMGGGLLGLVEGGVLLGLAVWALGSFAGFPDAELAAQTRLLSFLMTCTPLRIPALFS